MKSGIAFCLFLTLLLTGCGSSIVEYGSYQSRKNTFAAFHFKGVDYTANRIVIKQQNDKYTIRFSEAKSADKAGAKHNSLIITVENLEDFADALAHAADSNKKFGRVKYDTYMQECSEYKQRCSWSTGISTNLVRTKAGGVEITNDLNGARYNASVYLSVSEANVLAEMVTKAAREI